MIRIHARAVAFGAILTGSAATLAAEPAAVVQTCANIAEAAYGDSHVSALALQAAVDALVDDPSAEAAEAAWLAARVPYPQTGVVRIGNTIVEDLEGKVNASPLDEGLIDHLDGADGGPTDANPYAAANVIANPTCAPRSTAPC